MKHVMKRQFSKIFPSLLFLFQLTLIYPVLHSVKLSVTKLKTVLKNQLLRRGKTHFDKSKTPTKCLICTESFFNSLSFRKHSCILENFETNLNSEVITEPVITDLSNIDKVSLIGNLSLELQCKHKVPRIAVDKVISTFEHIMNEKLPEINSDFKRKSFLNKSSILLRPTLIMIEDTKCYVVSVIEIIKIFLQHPYLQQYLNSPVSSNYTNCVMKDIVDGSNFSVHPGPAQYRERNVLSLTLDLQFSVHDDGDRAATPGKQTIKETLFSKFKLPTFSSQVMPYLNGDDLGGTERKTIFNLLVNEIIYYLEKVMLKFIAVCTVHYEICKVKASCLNNENLLMSSNRNAQGIGYSQPQNKLLETYPKMLKEPHNLQRKHRSKGFLWEVVLHNNISQIEEEKYARG
ncbi:hypothetical protein Avbf_15316 [Armadillidium vulgare]|nr:hypothetical protein Avbf_15316 [Armadillidium vulgare]